MTVGFFAVFRRDPEHYILADILVRSVRAVMPGVPVVQFTDERSPAVSGVDAVRRKPNGKMLERRLEHYADCHGDWLMVDTDVVIEREVRQVFASPFDVALCDRDWPHVAPTPALTEEMPFNTGVVFSRSPEFWQRVLTVWRAYPDEQKDWLSEQRAVAQVVRSQAFRVRILPGSVYNYPPAADGEVPASVAVQHFKGPRKAWMRKRWMAGVPACV